MYERLENLVRLVPRSDGSSSVPAPLMLVEELGMIFQEHVDGQDLRAAAAVGDHGGLAARAGCWLAALHASAPVPGLKVMSVEREVAKVGQWAAEVAPYVTEAAAHRLHAACRALRALVSEAHAYRPAMIHKDFYYAHVRWSGTRLSVLDFDQLSIGDPAFDVGHFLAHLERHAHRTTGRFDAFAPLGADFLRSYLAHSAVDVRARVPFYRAYTFIKLAATEARRKQGAWQDATRALAEMGCRETQAQEPRVETELRGGRVPWAPVAGTPGGSTRHRGTSTRR
jgi:aminoglycoside phosphotransferase (APT) family kinase protein